MKADLTRKEPAMVARWLKDDIYGRIRQIRKNSPKFTLHDGPPYPNGDIHLGHALNKTLKDIVIKYHTMKGFDAPFIPGWDCHGLPIEHKVMLELGDKARSTSVTEIRKLCEEFAAKYVHIQREQFQRFLVFGDWEAPYLTLQPGYEAGVIETFNRMLKQGFVYRGLRPIHWCPSCRTALAEAEIDYKEKQSPSIFVKFPADSDLAEKFNIDHPKGPVSILIWTTTPWTLPANLAIAIGHKIEYCMVELDEDGHEEYLIMARKQVDNVFADLGKKYTAIHGSVQGSEIENLEYHHPFIDRICPLILANFVRIEDGTGCVHIAPGHGHDDYISGLEYNLPILSPVNREGRFTFEAPEFLEGMHVFDANQHIIQQLQDTGKLLHERTITHDYPHCWRCANAVIYRASDQWFISVDHNDLRKKAVAAVRDEIKWLPAWGSNRMGSMIANRPDWCISRQRIWGVPIPAFYCQDCGHTIATGETTDRVRDLFAEHSANCWFRMTHTELLPEDYKCSECGSNNIEKEHDIFDVWFESGSSHRSVVIQREDLQYPADLYLEGSDQHRGWFQLTLLPALAGTGKAPYKHVVTHGFTVDEHGKKMSKSLGNYIAAMDAVKKYGADILRLLFASVNYINDISIGEKILQQASERYRSIRNRFRFLLSNLFDFDIKTDAVPPQAMQEIDRWILHRLQLVIAEADRAYENYQFYRVYHTVFNFLEIELSSFYLDALKDRLYTETPADPTRRSAQTAMHRILVILTRLLAPILSYTCEEVWQRLHPGDGTDAMQSVHLEDFPKPDTSLIEDELEKRWSRLINVRNEVTKELEELRRDKTIGSFMEAQVILTCNDSSLLEFLKSFGEEELATLLIVSEVTLKESTGDSFTPCEGFPGLEISARKSKYRKCQRCWNFRAEVGSIAGFEDLCSRCAEIIALNTN
ncbi:isoleucine--tRNA ligase [Planctomycetota bacterium]